MKHKLPKTKKEQEKAIANAAVALAKYLKCTVPKAKKFVLDGMEKYGIPLIKN
jgi:dihydroxyacetone kinase